MNYAVAEATKEKAQGTCKKPKKNRHRRGTLKVQCAECRRKVLNVYSSVLSHEDIVRTRSGSTKKNIPGT